MTTVTDPVALAERLAPLAAEIASASMFSYADVAAGMLRVTTDWENLAEENARLRERSTISVYPVGLLSDIKRRRVWRGIRGYLIPQIQDRNWRAVKNYFNGYLAEIDYPPVTLNFFRCGKGWTRRAALSSLGRRLGADNAPRLNGARA
jgi:hypothetical protein